MNLFLLLLLANPFNCSFALSMQNDRSAIDIEINESASQFLNTKQSMHSCRMNGNLDEGHKINGDIKNNFNLDSLKFDGLYSCVEGDYQMSLRFYEDSLVITSSIDANITEEINGILNWFNRESDNFGIAKGLYSCKGDSIKFSTSLSAGTIHYSGIFKDNNRMELNIHSMINDYKAKHVFSLIPFN